MKITHICLCGPLTDNWSYQENLLPKYHNVIGYEVSVITSQYIFNDKGKLDIDDRNVYFNEYGVKTSRIKSKYNTTAKSKFKRYKNLYKTICSEKPDIIFVHGCQFLDIKYIVKYVKLNLQVKVYVDNHADFFNSASNWLSKNILHKIIWRRCGRMIEPYTTKFYGVSPSRVDFLKDIYKIPEEKVELLVMGADDEMVDLAKDCSRIEDLRNKHNIATTDFLIVTGGKIDYNKTETIKLMQAVKEIDDLSLKLIIFGSVIEELKDKFDSLIDGNQIQYIGWVHAADAYKYFSMAELVVFPGLHSVFWEQVVGLGVPIVVKHLKGFEHIDLGGNVKFLYKDSVAEIQEVLEKIISNKQAYETMQRVAKEKGMEVFSYQKIAQRSLEG